MQSIVGNERLSALGVTYQIPLPHPVREIRRGNDWKRDSHQYPVQTLLFRHYEGPHPLALDMELVHQTIK